MALIVQKFGGTSVANPQCIEHVAQKIIKTRAAGDDVVVVVSAMSGQTDHLIGLAKSVQARPDPREYSVLVSTGEQVSIALLAMQLMQLGCPAKSFTGAQVRILTEGDLDQARIRKIETEKIFSELKQGRVVVIAGFQGVDDENNITTLGRGGSDTTAVALAAALNASECQIYTDVEGVYTADPRIVPEARLVSEVTFDEMIELASLGAKVLQHRAVEFAGKYRVPLRVLSTFHEGPGTLIRLNEQSMEQAVVSGITYSRHEAKFTITGIPEDPDIIYKILRPIGQANIRVDMIMQSGAVNGSNDLSFTVSREDYHKTLDVLNKLVLEIGAKEIIANNHIGKLSIVGMGMRTHSGIASKLLESLSKEGIRIHSITTSEIKVSVLIDEKYLELGVRTLHSAFALEYVMVEEHINC